MKWTLQSVCGEMTNFLDEENDAMYSCYVPCDDLVGVSCFLFHKSTMVSLSYVPSLEESG